MYYYKIITDKQWCIVQRGICISVYSFYLHLLTAFLPFETSTLPLGTPSPLTKERYRP